MAVSFAETTCGLEYTLISSGKSFVVWIPAEESQCHIKGLQNTDTTFWINASDEILFLGLVSFGSIIIW